MKASELIKKVQELIELHGDVVITTFDLDRDTCEVEEVEFLNYPYNNIYIG